MRAALAAAGLEIVHAAHEGEWCGLTARLGGAEMPRLSYRRRLMLRKLLRVLGIVLAAAIVIGAALLLYLEPYVTYDRDGAHLSLKKNAQDPDGTGATTALPEVSDAQIVYDEAQPGSDRITDLGGVYVTTQMLRDPRPCARRSSSRGACAVLLQLKEHVRQFLLFQLHRRRGAGGRRYGGRGFPSSTGSASTAITSLRRSRPSATRRLRWPILPRPCRFRAERCGWTPTAATGLTPASETVMIYLKQIARELSSRGFREVVFSEFRFPASNSISYHSEKSGAELTQDAAQELTTFFSGSNLMISFETDDTAFPADVCTGRLYIRDVDGSKIEKFAQAYGSAENLTELVFMVNSKDTRFDERAVLRPLLNS